MDPKRPLPFFSEPTLSTFSARKSFLWRFTLPLVVSVILLFSNFDAQAVHPSFKRTSGGFGEEPLVFEHTEDEFSTSVEDTLHMDRISFAPRGDGLGYVSAFINRPVWIHFR